VPPSKRLPAWPRRGEGPRRGTSGPPANEQTQGSARWGLRPDLFRPSPNRATFQAPPSVAEERGGSAAGDICPPREWANSGERQVGLKAGFIPAVPQPCHLPSASQRGRGEGRVPRRGTSVPPANGQTQGSARWGLRPDLFRPSPNRATFQAPPSVAEERGGFRGGGHLSPPRMGKFRGAPGGA